MRTGRCGSRGADERRYRTVSLTRSARSGAPRTASRARLLPLLLCCYNRADNNPVIRHHHPFYTPLDIVDDGALLRTGLWSVGFERSFMDPAEDISIGDFEADPLG